MDAPAPRKPYPTDVTDEEWAFVAPYLTLLDPDAPQRRHDLREVFDALVWIVRAGSPWRMLPTNLPPWAAVHQQTRAPDRGRVLRGYGPRPAGADLVVYSGGKGIRGPQDSGMLAGRRDLIEAARANGSPFAGIGRGMKVSKEAMVGLEVALRRFLVADHGAERALHGRQTDLIEASLDRRRDVTVVCERDWEAWPAPVIRVHPAPGARWSPEAVRDAIMAGDPSVHLNVERGGLMINTHCLQEGDEMTLAECLATALDGVA